MKYKYKPRTKSGLVKAIKKEIYKIQGTPDNPNWQADLNCIDTSLITDMSNLFSYEYGLNELPCLNKITDRVSLILHF